ncbi:MAG TPA: ATP-binding protein [Lachnospiraceae bacterium]|nr:ATP-binding protein [Lachnospiraceae bacterium]
MKKKINFQLMVITTVAIFATMILISAVFYDIYQDQIVDDLKTVTTILVDTAFTDNDKHLLENHTDNTEYLVRITLINGDGTVCYDSEAEDSSLMDNHNSRPEVIEARKSGEGISVRRSATVGISCFYYARRLDNGTIIRVAKEASSIFRIYINAMPVILVIVLLLIMISLVASRLLTKRLVKPIEQLVDHLGDVDEFVSYEELQPFINTIQKQHEDIMKNAFMRQEFTANVSHELKTPLTSITGYAELIETGMASDEDIRRFAAGIHKNSNRLLTLINDIIRLSELDGTEQEVVLERVNLYMIARACVNMLQFSADKHMVTLRIEGKDCYIPGNRQMLDELLYNLCDNAIRYNNEGGIVVVSIRDLGDKVELKVRDTGIGIPKEAQSRIFERFYRVDKSRSKSTGGTGLGLAIVKHIITKLHAQLDLKSKVGEGTEVTVLFLKKMEAVI